MKNIRLAMVIACTLLGTAVVNAQSLYDAARLMGNDLNGTARFIGMAEPWEHYEVTSQQWELIRQVLEYIEVVM